MASKIRAQIKKEEIMQPTAWEIQNHLAAILNFARQSGKFWGFLVGVILAKAGIEKPGLTIELCNKLKKHIPGEFTAC